MKYAFTLWIVFLSSFILLGLASAINVSAANSSEISKLNVTLLDYGSIGDHGWSYEAHEGATKMAQTHPYVDFLEIENAAGPGTVDLLRRSAQERGGLIFCHSSAFAEAISHVAPEYPNVIFMLGGGTWKLASNSGIYYERIYEAQYLAGMVAGNMTKTNKVAFVAALPTSQVIIGINAFAKGVAVSNPKARVYVDWIEEWYNPEEERVIALALMNEGCDIITHWSDSDAAGQTADEMGVRFISFGSGEGRYSPNVFLTGALWNWEPVMSDIVESVYNGTWQDQPSQEWWYGFKEGGVKLAAFGEMVPESVRSEVKERQDEIVKGELEVFPGLSDEELKKMYYLEPNVVGSLVKGKPASFS